MAFNYSCCDYRRQQFGCAVVVAAACVRCLNWCGNPVIVANIASQAFAATLAGARFYRAGVIVGLYSPAQALPADEKRRSVWPVWYWSSVGRTDASPDFCGGLSFFASCSVDAASRVWVLHLRAAAMVGNAFRYQRLVKSKSSSFWWSAVTPAGSRSGGLPAMPTHAGSRARMLLLRWFQVYGVSRAGYIALLGC